MRQTAATHGVPRRIDGLMAGMWRAGPFWLGCVVAAAAAVAIYVARLPIRFDELHAPSASIVAALDLAGVAPRTYALITLALEITVVVAAAGLAAVILLNETDRRWGGFVALMLALLAAALPVSDLLVGATSRADTINWWIAGLAWSLVFVFLYRFPDGHFVPPVIKWFAVARVVEVMLGTAFSGSQLDAYTWPPLLRLADWVFWFGSAIVAQRIRYSTSRPTEQQQARGLSLVVSLLIIAVLVIISPPMLFPQLHQTSYVLIIQPLTYVCGLGALFGVAFFGAYRPWAVDFVVRRALVYVTLTAVLAAIYSVCVNVFSVVLVGMANAPVVIATFVVVLLLTPLRDGLKLLVDKKVKEHKDPLEAVTAITEQARAVVSVIDADLLGEKVLDETVRAFKAQSGALRIDRVDAKKPAHVWGDWDNPDGLDVSHPPSGNPIARLRLRPPPNVRSYGDEERSTIAKVLPEIAEVVRLAEGKRRGSR